MKHVYLIGDSIRLGYAAHVRALLEGKATVDAPEENCRFLQHTLRFLHEWAETASCPPEDIDLVHWNNGSWDVCHFWGDPAPMTSLAQYGQLLRHVHGQIRRVFPRARIVFATTTPVDESRPKFQQGVPVRTNAEIEAFNQVAKDTMAELRVPVNDLYLFAQDLNALHDDWVHYTPEGSRALAGKVVSFMEPYLTEVETHE